MEIFLASKQAPHHPSYAGIRAWVWYSGPQPSSMPCPMLHLFQKETLGPDTLSLLPLGQGQCLIPPSPHPSSPIWKRHFLSAVCQPQSTLRITLPGPLLESWGQLSLFLLLEAAVGRACIQNVLGTGLARGQHRAPTQPMLLGLCCPSIYPLTASQTQICP